MSGTQQTKARRNMKHCPVEGCNRRCSNDYLMCRPHWAKVKRETQNRVYRTWQSGDLGAYSEAASDAIAQAEAK